MSNTGSDSTGQRADRSDETAADRRRGPRPPEDPGSIDLAREAALRILTNAAQPSAVIAAKLAARGFEEQAIWAVIDRFTEVGLINDLDYARSLVRNRRDSAGRSRRAISEEMRTKGIEPGVAETALEEYAPEGELEVAAAFVARKLRRGEDLSDAKTVRRIFGALARRGFSPDVIARALRAHSSQ
ncbi:hypothetical protein GCM10010401_02190 [Rarobacter faecitabidus]|uniref:Regulatory protein RecX n=1 Tax=Rarobacter faecitabidus TaxID=13243 RepID=A0A542ZWB2_RARFA|nr:regulatory protein RecX [Rarobacter faecitabidus]TQL64645.1 regulatory protein [Rarobacter faecitabidus]